MRTCVIFNPAARGDKARRFRRQLDVIGPQCALKATTAPDDARRLAAEAVGEGFDLIVAAGGDGTVNEVLNGLGDAPDGFARARFGVLPLGTVNVFARELKIPLRLERAWDVLQRGREMRIDLPHVEFSDSGTRRQRCFVQLAGAGMDARTIELVDWEHKKKVGPLAYLIAGLKAMREQKPEIIVRAEGRERGRAGFDWQRPVLRRAVRNFSAGRFARRVAGDLCLSARQLADFFALPAAFYRAAKIAGGRGATRPRGGV